ncbi:alpha/beta fold hydrolase [Candidatus Contubernalis alkaliaceticus]|uniref:alpha/beta fold hydrolase n=1 Tax=Candidatus Contubernalis alkaliaceticus TaxID=338645 RepID=UPI001F4BE9E4|nr:alpha/beta hydrolase [Candidatus Contubernalis alkalaceticus]UNC91264.1 alpha/beta hydrolase [Candidatus Contubernalis alkalaceticus]
MTSRKMVIAKMTIIIIMIILSVILVLGNVVNFLSKDRSVDRLITKKIEINGSMQWISLSEELLSNDKPVVLFLHGGPGSANLSLLNQVSPGLNDHAIIVNWDQRNAGKSFSIFQPKTSLNFEQNIEDAHVLTQYLKDKFDVDRISLIGFSAGTALGIMLIDRYPDDYNLFISVAQMIDGQRGELFEVFPLNRTLLS